MSIKDIKEWFGFGDKRPEHDYSYPSSGYYGDGYVYPQQYYRDPLPAQKPNSMPPLGVSTLVLPNCTVEKMSVEKLLESIQPPAKDVAAAKDKVDTKETIVSSDNVKTVTDAAAPNKADAKIATKDAAETKQQPVRPTLSQPRELIIIFVENTPNVFERKADVLNILNAILSTKKNALFLLNRLGKTSTFFSLLDYEDVTAGNILPELFNPEDSSEKPRLADAFAHVDKYSKKNIWPRFDFKNVSYRISSCNIICIGSRDTIDIEIGNEDVAKSLLSISERFKVDNFRYLCFSKEEDISIFHLKLPKNKSGIYLPIKPQPKDIIIFIVGNTPSVLAQKNNILAILKQLAASQKASLFLLVKVGKVDECSQLIDYDTISKSDLLVDLFDENISSEQTYLASALVHVKDTLTPLVTTKFTFKNRDCISSSFSFVCIGSGSAFDNEKSRETIATCIKAFTRWSKTKNLKYLCVSDRETIKVAALGFPDVKHIITNFYY